MNPVYLRRSLMKRFLFAFGIPAASVLVFVSTMVGQVRSQSVPDSFDPNVNGTVNAIVLQSDGKIVLGGAFTTVSPNGGSPVARNNIARFNPDGTLDTAFDANADNTVHALALQADGKILVGGDFNNIGGQGRSRIARLNTAAGSADSFNPIGSGPVEAIAVQADGRIVIGGFFSSVGGQTRNNIARLDATTGAPDSWDPNASQTVLTLTIQPDGKILAGGSFSTIGGQTRRCIARLDPVTGLADSFNPSPGQGTNQIVFAMVVQPDGKVVFGGNFLQSFQTPFGRLARVDATGQVDSSFRPNPNNRVTALALLPDGKILVSGLFSSIGGQSRNLFARIDAATGAADSLQPNPSNLAYSIVPQPDGKILVGGLFTAIGGASRNHIARLLPEGGSPAVVGNVSTRLPVGAGDDALIEGFIVQGPDGSAKKIMVRALGPSLLPFGIADALANPVLEIHDSSGATLATNNDWRNTQIGGLITGDQSAEISSSGLAPSDDLESAIIANLAPGSYTAVVRGTNNSTGTGIVDAYDLSGVSPAKVANVATRGLIQPGDKLMIAGFIIQNAPVKAVIRAIGPSLEAFGVTNALPDTTLELHDRNGALILQNDDWKTGGQQELESLGLQPSHDLEAAMVLTLPPSQYTVQVRGKNDASGIGVVQVYFLQ